MIEVAFTEIENRIRKRWLFWVIKLPAFVTGCVIALTLIRGFVAANFMAVLAIFVYSLFSLGGFYVSYYCAYKKPGTFLLLLMIIGTTLSSLPLLLKNVFLMKVSMIFGLCLLPLLFYQFIVMYYTYKLRKVNQQMKERRLVACPVYVHAMSLFSTAANVEELNAQFAELKASQDLKSVVVKAYRRQKKKWV